LRPEQGLFDAGRLGRRGLGGLRLRLRVHRDFFGRRRHRRLFAFGALRPLIEIEGLQRRDAAREGAISDPRDIRSPQFLEEKATGIARRPSEVAWTRSEAETIEGRKGPATDPGRSSSWPRPERERRSRNTPLRARR